MTTEEFHAWLVANYELCGEDIKKKGSDRVIMGALKSCGYHRCDFNIGTKPDGSAKQKGIAYHRLKFLLAHGFVTEAIDHHLPAATGHNNARRNLRAASAKQNAANRKKPAPKKGKKASTPYKGVSTSRKGRYVARFEKKYQGTFDCPIAAAKHVDDLARAKWGLFAAVNFPRHCDERPAI